MKPDDLIQNALLEVLGVLEPEEAEAFERAFREADPALRAQIRLEQTRLLDLGELLPDVRPPAALKAQVMRAVRDEVNASQPTVIPELEADLETEFGGAIAGSIRPQAPSAGVRVWRAAAVALGAATIGLAASTLYMTAEFQSIENQAIANGEVDTFLELGAGMTEMMFSPDARLSAFTPTPAGGEARAMLAFDSTTGQGRLLWRNLPADTAKPYALVELDDSGNVVREITTFHSNYGLVSTAVSFGDARPSRLAVMSPRDAEGGREILLTLTLA